MLGLTLFAIAFVLLVIYAATAPRILHRRVEQLLDPEPLVLPPARIDPATLRPSPGVPHAG